MECTWQDGNKTEWTLYHWFYELLGLHPVPRLDMGANKQPTAESSAQQKVSYVHTGSIYCWVTLHGLMPIFLHQIYLSLWSSGVNLNLWQTYILYAICLNISTIRGQRHLRHLVTRTGFLGGDACERDTIPDNGVKRLAQSLVLVLWFRPLLIILAGFQQDNLPRDCRWIGLPFMAGLYALILDFWFYWFHRLMHNISFLRKHHKLHHLSRRPTILLSVYLNDSELFLDHFLVPLLTYHSLKAIGLSLSFNEWWVCNWQILFVEMTGHSGMRAYASAPNIFNPLLRWINCELIIEDHDLHHRMGYKNSGNFGKQTLVWDTLFGTRKDRIECRTESIDWDSPIMLPVL